MKTFKLKFMNGKGQVGETVTWMVATLIIIVILFIFLAISGVIKFPGQIFVRDRNVDLLQGKTSDLLAMKSFSAYLLSDNTFNDLNSESNLGENTGKLAQNVFYFLYFDPFMFVKDEVNENIVDNSMFSKIRFLLNEKDYKPAGSEGLPDNSYLITLKFYLSKDKEKSVILSNVNYYLWKN